MLCRLYKFQTPSLLSAHAHVIMGVNKQVFHFYGINKQVLSSVNKWCIYFSCKIISTREVLVAVSLLSLICAQSFLKNCNSEWEGQLVSQEEKY